MGEPATFPIDTLHGFTGAVFRHFGVPDGDAARAADVLAAADLRGIDSHGVARLRTYTDLLAAGRIDPSPRIEVIRETPGTATVDGGNGLGLVVGPRANEMALAKAEACGSGWVAVRNTNHFGIAGYYVLQALERGLIGWAMTNSTALVAPLWGAERMLGTNPIAVGFPAGEEPPVVVDMATSAVAYGKVEIEERAGRALPAGWVIDRDGRVSDDPAAVREGGALLPLGSTRDMGGHKGYCLAAAVDLLTAVLSGANWGPWAPSFTLDYADPDRRVGEGIGHFFGAMRVDAFIDAAEFGARVDDWIRTMRATRPQPGTDGPLIPGDPERLAEQARRRDGIPVTAPVLADLRRIADRTGVPLPAPG